jgi:hypothetical protein
VRRVQGGRDRAALDLEHVGDLLVLHVGVVAQKDGEPLSLRERSNRDAQLRPLLGMVVRICELTLADRYATVEPRAVLRARLVTIAHTHASGEP